MKISSNTIQLPKIIWKEDDSIGTLIIHKINLKEPLYSKNSPKNTIEQHVSILEESILPYKENSILILAAHSGTGEIAYFNNLNQLEIEDTIEVIYREQKYHYQVTEIWKEKKNGYIHINKGKGRQLILTTCDPIQKNYQIIVSCTEKESN